MSRLVRTQNRELPFRCIAYNTKINQPYHNIDGFYKAVLSVNRIVIKITYNSKAMGVIANAGSAAGIAAAVAQIIHY